MKSSTFTKFFLAAVTVGATFSLTRVSHAADIQYVLCESNSDRFRRCDVNGRIEDVTVYNQRSNADCREGRSWGYDRNSIWVDRGCRAVFRVELRSQRISTEIIRCESQGERYKTCEANGRISDVNLNRQISNADCRKGKTWGFNRNSIWVDKGCRGDFRVTYTRRDN